MSVLGLAMIAVPSASAVLQTYTWGRDAFGELGNGTTEVETNTPGTISLKAAKSVAAGEDFSLVLMGNGTVKSFGLGTNGQLGDGKLTSSNVPVTVTGLSGVKAITAGNNSALALTKTEAVWSWGSYEYGQVGDGKEENTAAPVEIISSGVTAVASEGAHDLALLKNGTVLAWGRNGNGELGLGSTEPGVVKEPTEIPGLKEVKAIATGAYFSLAVLKNGTVKAWGDNSEGQLGNGKSGENVLTPQTVPGLVKVKSVSAGSYFSLALLTNGTAKAWGSNADGDLGDGESGGTVLAPVTVTGLTEATVLAAHESWAIALRKTGAVLSWGSNFGGELGLGGGGAERTMPTTIGTLSGAKAVAAGFGFGLAVAP